jgi:hypothetical protein
MEFVKRWWPRYLQGLHDLQMEVWARLQNTRCDVRGCHEYGTLCYGVRKDATQDWKPITLCHEHALRMVHRQRLQLKDGSGFRSKGGRTL